MNEIETAWLAGLIEGEGYMSITRGRYIRLGINMCDVDVLFRVREITGVGYVTERKTYSDKHSRQFRWLLSQDAQVREVLTAILPFMGERRTARINELLAVPPVGPRSGGRKAGPDLRELMVK